MNWLVFHIVSGQAFFTGIAMLIGAASASLWGTGAVKRLGILGGVIGLIAVGISSTPLPYWYYGIAGLVTLAWIGTQFRNRWRRSVTFAFIAVWLIAAGLELPYHLLPSLSPASSRSITVIGDSVTAGVGGDEKSERWPSILAREHRLNVQDISHMGETAASARKRAKTESIESPIVLLEIGGNDVLGSTTATQFAHDLDRLLADVSQPNRQLVMFELPLPPFANNYGLIQRALAKKYHVALVPKRVFLSILAGEDSTLDTIHLSQTGHQHMAECVWRIIQPAFATSLAT